MNFAPKPDFSELFEHLIDENRDIMKLAGVCAANRLESRPKQSVSKDRI